MLQNTQQQSHSTVFLFAGLSLAFFLGAGCVKVQKTGTETQGTPAQTPSTPIPEAADPNHSQAPESTDPKAATAPSISPAPPQETVLVVTGSWNLNSEYMLKSGHVMKKPGSPETYLIHVDKLIFKDQARIKTEGLNLEIETKNLLVEGKATVVTFAKSDKAGIDTLGRAGGRVSLHAQLAEGQLVFILNGENGGDGSAGAAPGPEKNGSAGANGADGKADVMPAIPPWGQPQPWCKLRPKEGEEGSSGLSGNPGQPGQRGGNSAELILKIYDRQDFHFLIVEQSPGAGGLGGPGGAGGQPGPQGQNGILQKTDEYRANYGGVPETDKMCPIEPSFQPNPSPGAHGPSGANGLSGEDGQNSL